MKVILYNAVSLDGFIATPDGDSEWALDGDEFEALVAKTGCILIGRQTFEQYQKEIYPIEQVVNFVYTSRADDHKHLASENLEFIGGSPKEALAHIQARGFDAVILGGGSKTNASFAEAGLIDEMILDIHPLLLGDGLKLLGNYDKPLKLDLISSTNNPKGYIQNYYKLMK